MDDVAQGGTLQGGLDQAGELCLCVRFGPATASKAAGYRKEGGLAIIVIVLASALQGTCGQALTNHEAREPVVQEVSDFVAPTQRSIEPAVTIHKHS